jgi:Protein of unknown function (DUF732)
MDLMSNESKLWGSVEMALIATRVAVALGALLVGPLGAAATAHADSHDQMFLSALQSEGITDHVSSSHAIEAGHMVCDKLDGGLSPSDEASDVLLSSQMPAYHAGYFVGASIKAYCPQYQSKINSDGSA